MTERQQRKERVGTVVSDKMDKTVVVSVERNFVHSAYDRIIRKNSKYVAHDEKDECKTVMSCGSLKHGRSRKRSGGGWQTIVEHVK